MPSYPQYSADFFDGKHFVMKGASPGDRARAHAAEASATGFGATYPYVYAKFRTVE